MPPVKGGTAVAARHFQGSVDLFRWTWAECSKLRSSVNVTRALFSNLREPIRCERGKNISCSGMAVIKMVASTIALLSHWS